MVLFYPHKSFSFNPLYLSFLLFSPFLSPPPALFSLSFPLHFPVSPLSLSFSDFSSPIPLTTTNTKTHTPNPDFGAQPRGNQVIKLLSLPHPFYPPLSLSSLSFWWILARWITLEVRRSVELGFDPSKLRRVIK